MATSRLRLPRQCTPDRRGSGGTQSVGLASNLQELGEKPEGDSLYNASEDSPEVKARARMAFFKGFRQASLVGDETGPTIHEVIRHGN